MSTAETRVRSSPVVRAFGGSLGLGLIVALGWQFLGTLAIVTLGASVRDAALLTLAVGVQALGGLIIWSFLTRGRSSGPELLGMSLVIGSVLAVLVGIAGNSLLFWEWWWAMPTAVLLVVWSIKRPQHDECTRQFVKRDWWPVSAGFAIGMVLLFLNLRRYPLSWQGIWDGYHPDVVFFEALGYSVATFGPMDSIFMAGADLRYHWLTYAWTAQLSTALNAEPFVVLTRILPLVALIALVALVAAVVRRMGNHLPYALPAAALWLAVGLVVTGGYVGAVNGTILNFDSPSQALTAAWLMGLVLVVMVLLETSQRLMALMLTTAVLVFAITAGKVSAGFVATSSIAIAAVAGLAMRRPWAGRAVLVAGVVVAASLAAFVVFMWGSASPGDLRLFDWDGRASTVQGLNSSPGVRGVALGTLTLTLAMTARWLGAGWLLTDPFWRGRFETWLGIGFVIAAVVPVALFAQGLNETWFALTASAPLSALAAVGLVVAWHRAGLSGRDVVTSVIVGLIAIGVVAYVWTDQVWESGLGRFFGPWIGLGLAMVGGFLVTVFRRRFDIVVILAAATLVFTVEAVGARATPIIGAILGGARDGSGVRTVSLAEPSLPSSQFSTGNAPDSESTSNTGAETERAAHAWSSDLGSAAAYLRANSSRSDIVLTNETEAYIVPALTQRRAFIAGSPYQVTYGSVETADRVPERIEENSIVILGDQQQSRTILCASTIAWIWLSIDRDPINDVSALAHLAYENSSVRLYRVDKEQCSPL